MTDPHLPTHGRVRRGAKLPILALLAALLVAALVPALALSRPTNPTHTGQTLVADIRDRLANDPHTDHTLVPDLRVTARSTEGVTVSGTPATLLARERVLSIAHVVAGDATVVDELAPILPSRTDAEIATDVQALVDAEPLLADARVHVQHHEVHLSGEVASRQLAHLAVHLASDVTGVTRVHDLFEIVEPDRRTDADIDRELEATLDWDPAIDARHIEVAVSGGRVTLSGRVGSAAEKSRAVLDSWTAGVVSVIATDLVVSSTSS